VSSCSWGADWKTTSAWSISSRRHEFVEDQSTLLGLGFLFGGEITVRLDLIRELVLLEAARIARGLGWSLGVVTNGVCEIVGHEECLRSEGETWSPTVGPTGRQAELTEESCDFFEMGYF
jgi:hypothetical protein